MKVADILKGRWATLNEPVLKPGEGNAWDNLSVITPGIFAGGEASRYGMFYVGLSKGSDTWGIGYAGSDDLLVWRKHGLSPVIRYEDDGHCVSLDSPCLVRKDGKLHLFCEEKRFRKGVGRRIKHMLPAGVRRRLATLRRLVKGGEAVALSVQHADGRYFVSFTAERLLEWDAGTRQVVFEKGPPGMFDGSGLFSPQVHEFDGRYHMFYGGSNGNVTSTGLAVSNDLVNWQRGSAPLLQPGAKGEWDENNALIVSVLRMEDGYCGFYEGEDAKNRYRIGLAFSRDLRRWEKFEGNPIIKNGGKGSFSERMACSPHIFSDGNRVVLFYTGHDRDMRGSCGAAVFESC